MSILDPRVVEFAVDAGLRVIESEGAVRLETSDTGLVVREDDGSIRVEMIERGVLEGVDLVTGSRALLDRFIVLRAGLTWRSRHRLGHPPAPGPRSLPGGNSVREQPDGWSVVVSQEGSAEVTSVHEARRLARAVAFGVDEVIASVKDPHGRPALVP